MVANVSEDICIIGSAIVSGNYQFSDEERTMVYWRRNGHTDALCSRVIRVTHGFRYRGTVCLETAQRGV